MTQAMATTTRTTPDLAPPEGGDADRRPLRPAERVLIALEGFMAVCGLAGGLYMASHPTTTMPLRYLDGTWFHTWRWPGVALAFFVGVCPAVVAGATWRRRPAATIGHVAVGLGLVAWILLEAAWVVVSPALQITVGLVGVVILVLGTREWVRSGFRSRPRPPT